MSDAGSPAAADAYGDDELAALYDLVYDDVDDDLSLYENFAARGDTPSLELAVGSGRVALHLARTGHDVIGVDLSPFMLRRLEARLDASTTKRVRLLEGDIRKLRLRETFGLVYIALGSLQLFTEIDDALAVLRTVRRHLAPGGVFVSELSTIGSVDWAARDPQTTVEWTRIDPATGELVTKTSTLRASPATQTTTTSLIFDRFPVAGGPLHRRAFDVTLRIYGRFELEMLIERAGLRLQHVYGGTDLSPFSDASDSMIIVAGRGD